MVLLLFYVVGASNIDTARKIRLIASWKNIKQMRKSLTFSCNARIHNIKQINWLQCKLETELFAFQQQTGSRAASRRNLKTSNGRLVVLFEINCTQRLIWFLLKVIFLLIIYIN